MRGDSRLGGVEDGATRGDGNPCRDGRRRRQEEPPKGVESGGGIDCWVIEDERQGPVVPSKASEVGLCLGEGFLAAAKDSETSVGSGEVRQGKTNPLESLKAAGVRADSAQVTPGQQEDVEVDSDLGEECPLAPPIRRVMEPVAQPARSNLGGQPTASVKTMPTRSGQASRGTDCWRP